MTYPQQQHQPQPQYGAPQGTPWMPPQYGGAPAQPAPQAQPQLGGQAMPTAAPKLGESGKGGGGATAPAPRHLVGRTVIFEPIRIDETTTQRDNAGNMVVRPTAYYNLTVVDGGPLQYGDNRDHDISKQHGMTMEIATPCRFTNVSSDRFGIVNEVRDTMARGELASVGVIQQGTKGNRPFLVTKCSRDLDGNERPDGAQRFEAATQIWNAIFAKTFRSPEPRSLVAPPAQQPPQVAYQPTAPAGYAAQQYAQTGTVPTPYGAAPAGQLHPEYVAAATQPAYQPPANPMAQYQQQPPMIPGYAGPVTGAGIPTEYHVQPQQPSPYAQAAQASAPPANPAFEAWLATLPPEQQAAQRAALAGPAAQPAQPQGPGI